MSKAHETIDSGLISWITKQKMFFVGSAPLSAERHVNVSPKGGDAFRVLGPLEVVYQDYTGSGAETAAHLRENGRIVILFCAFEGSPKIARLHGHGTLVTPGHPRYGELCLHFPDNPGTRAFVLIAVNRVSTSCGYSVPLYEFQGHRKVLDDWATQQGPQGIEDYRRRKNQRSIDGLPAFEGL